MASIKVWPVLREISVTLFPNIHDIYVFGNTGEEVIAVTKDDNVYAFGLNNSGCLGLGHTMPVKEPTIVSELCQKRIKTFISGFYSVNNAKAYVTFVLALTKFGEIYSWGTSPFGTLGNGSATNQKPKIIAALNGVNIIDVCCGRGHCLALSDSGEVYAWGYNKSGECGNGNEETQQMTPTKVVILNGPKVVSIVCGGYHSLALTESGELYGWGLNGNGQLGGESRESLRSPLKVNLSAIIIIKKVSAGSNHTIILTSDGYVYLFNSNERKNIEDQNDGNNVLPFRLSLPFKIMDILSVPQYDVSIGMSEDMKCYVLNNCKYPTELPETTLNDAFNSVKKIKVTLKPVAIKQFISTPVMLNKHSHSFDNQKYSDIAFKIDGKYIYAQKLFLRSICKHFDVMFGDKLWLESNTNEIPITQYSYSVFYAFLKYLHTNSIDINFDEVIDMLDLANSYLEDELKKECIEVIKRGIDIENVCHFYSVGVKYELNALENFCADFASFDINRVFQTKSFKELDDILVRKLFVKYGEYVRRNFLKIK